MKTKKIFFSTALFALLCFAVLQQACAQPATRTVGFIKATTDTTFRSLKYATLGCKAFGNTGEEAKVWFTVSSSTVGDTVLIDAGDSYTWTLPQAWRWGTINIDLYTLSAYPTDSAGNVAPYVKCMGY